GDVLEGIRMNHEVERAGVERQSPHVHLGITGEPAAGKARQPGGERASFVDLKDAARRERWPIEMRVERRLDRMERQQCPRECLRADVGLAHRATRTLLDIDVRGFFSREAPFGDQPGPEHWLMLEGSVSTYLTALRSHRPLRHGFDLT